MNLLTRIRRLIARGRVTLVDDSKTAQLVQVSINGLETSDSRIRMAEFGFSSNPPEGSDAVLINVAGDPSASAVIATNHQPSRPTGMASGESMLYSQDGKHVYLTADGGIVVEAKGQNVVVNDAANVTVNASGQLEINAPNIVLNGNVQINGNIGQAGASGEAGTATFTAPITAPDIELPNGPVNEHNHFVPAAPGYSNVMTN